MRTLLALLFALWALPAAAQNVTCATRAPGDSTNACASTAFVQQSLTGLLPDSGWSPGLPLIGSLTGTVSQGTRGGNTTVFGTVQGALTNGHCVSIDSNGNFIDAGAACTTGGGGGTVTSSTMGYIGYYAASGNTISGISVPQLQALLPLAINAKASPYNAVGNGTTDDTAALQAAITACFSVQGELYIPAGTYKISSALVTTSGKTCMIRGAGSSLNGGSGTVIYQSSTTADGIDWKNGAVTLVNGGGIRDLTILAGTTAGGINSSGVGLWIQGVQDHFIADHVVVQNFAVGWSIDFSWNSSYTNDDCYYAQFQCVLIGANQSGGSNMFENWNIYNGGVGAAGATATGLQVVQSGGEEMINVNVSAFYNGIQFIPGAGQSITYMFMTHVLADTNTNIGMIFNGNNGTITSTMMTNCWVSFNGAQGISLFGSAQGKIQGWTWAAGRIRENGQDGIDIFQASNWAIQDSEIASNGRLGTPGQYSGIAVSPNVFNFQITNNRIGNFASSYTNQGHCVITGGNNSTFMGTGNMCLGTAGGASAYSINTFGAGNYFFPSGNNGYGGNL